MIIEIIGSKEAQELPVGLKIRHVRKSLKMTQKRFAESLGIVQGFLSAIEKGKKTPSYTLLIALQHLYGINPEWIHSGKGEIMQSNLHYKTSHPEALAIIPLLNKLPADTTEFLDSNSFDRYISLPGVPSDSFAFEYSGDYMLPTIRDGDIIVIRPGETLTSGNIGLIVGKWGEAFLRRYREINGESYFSSDNTAYTSFQPDASTKILGVVVKIWREIKI